MAMTPTQLSLRTMKAEGWPLVEVVERWNPHARVRHDLFGILDILAIDVEGKTVGVQTTSASNVSARIKKIDESPALPVLKAAGWLVVVHGWAKTGRMWELKREVWI